MKAVLEIHSMSSHFGLKLGAELWCVHTPPFKGVLVPLPLQAPDVDEPESRMALSPEVLWREFGIA